MIDGIIKADGTSRLMRANLPATYEEFKAQAAAGTLPLDVLFNAGGWSQLPTFLNKNNLLRDNTADLFGFNADAVPDDVFSYLGEYAKHWWRRKSIAVLTKYKQTTMSLSTKYGNVDVKLTKTTGDVYYSSAVSVNEDTGVVSLVNPVLWPGQSGSRIDDLLGKYVQSNTAFTVNSAGTVIVEVLRLANQMSSDSATSTYGIYNNAYFTIVSSESYTIDAGEWSMVSSADRNAYPDSGESGGFAWVYNGIPFKKMPFMPQIATGSYTGTGTYGASNPSSLTFDFVPKMLFILESSKDGRPIFSIFCTWPEALSSSYAHYGYTALTSALTITGTKAFAKFTGTTFSWYATDSARNQMNSNEYNYRYIAIC